MILIKNLKTRKELSKLSKSLKRRETDSLPHHTWCHHVVWLARWRHADGKALQLTGSIIAGMVVA
ncbi:hypothetical protein BD408DRAFT_407749 [Parasitella parasitica]|nr:hypothetical protein BD408DRAFT_418063 [Parasitella parasitica]KAI8646081.1 hypothetical protein BD408DRAFT_410637 [Parasitella parasitica]KAI8647749.1 hypothetical protein BD408DRAFT_407749 [Parasitella parasitica]